MFQKNADYPEQIQARAYHGDRGQAAREHVVQNTAQLKPRAIVDRGGGVVDGPPLVTKDGITVAGNSRVMMVQRAAEVHPAKYDDYRNTIRDRASDFGLKPGDVDGFRRPMLVRMIDDPAVTDTDIAQLKSINRASDTPSAKAKDVISDAATMASRLKDAPSALEHLAATMPPESTLRDYLGAAEGRSFVRRMVEDGVIPRQDVARYVDVSSGRMTPTGVESLQKALYAAAIGDADAMSAAPASALRKIEHAIPALVSASATEGWSLEAPMREALELLEASRAAKSGSVDEFLAQQDVFGRTFSREAQSLARYIEEEPKQSVSAAFREYAASAQRSVREGISDDLFGYAPEKPAEALQRIFGRSEGMRVAERLSERAAYVAERRRAPGGEASGQLDLAFGTEGEATRASDRVVDRAGKYATVSVDRPVLSGPERRNNVRQATRRRAWVDIRGQTVRSGSDAIRLLAPFRDPGMEKLHVILVDGDGRVLSHTLQTSGAIDYVFMGKEAVEHKGVQVPTWLADVEKRAARLGATRMALAHNHPSGNPTPSRADLVFTRMVTEPMARYGIKVDAHYVLDHGTAVEITRGATGSFAQTHVTLPAVRGTPDWTGGTGQMVGRPEDLQTVVAGIHKLATRNAGVYALHVDSQNNAVALVPHTAAAVEKLLQSRSTATTSWLEAERKAMAALHVILAVDGSRHPTLYRSLLRAAREMQPEAKRTGVPSPFANILSR